MLFLHGTRSTRATRARETASAIGTRYNPSPRDTCTRTYLARLEPQRVSENSIWNGRGQTCRPDKTKANLVFPPQSLLVLVIRQSTLTIADAMATLPFPHALSLSLASVRLLALSLVLLRSPCPALPGLSYSAWISSGSPFTCLAWLPR